MITQEHIGILVCHNLNVLDDEGCCADCCAPCGVLRDLDDAGYLDNIVVWAPPHLWGDGIEWWRGDGVDREWLHARWRCTSHPPCERVKHA